MVIRLLTIFAIIVLVLSIVVHVCTFIPGVPVSMGNTWPLHLLCMIAFATAVLPMALLQRKLRPKPLNGQAQRESFKRILRPIPILVRVVVIVTVADTGMNFALFVTQMKGGNPVEENGQYYLNNHGERTGTLTKAEYHQHQAYMVRGFSGHWIFFSLLPVVFFRYVHPSLKSELAALQEEPSCPPQNDDKGCELS